MQFNNQLEDIIHFATTPHSKISRQPSIYLPFHRDNHFISRDELTTLCYQLSSPGTRTAVVGLEGLGKTRLAIEFAYRFHEENPEVWLFWVDASSEFRLEESYQIIADALQIPGRAEDDVDLLALVHSWLTHHELGPWIIIVDNANDVRLLSDKSQDGESQQRWIPRRPLLDYLPSLPHSNGRILIMTHHQAIASNFTQAEKGVVSLGSMQEDCAVQLLQKRFEASTTVHDADTLRSLAQALHCIPLALVQAAAYICQTVPQSTVADYVGRLQASEHPYTQLVQIYGQHDTWWRRTSPDSVVNTFHLNFMLLRDRFPSACRLLSLMSFFEREGIADNLLIGWYLAEGQDTGDEAAIFDTDIAVLQHLRLVDQNRHEEISSFHIHRTVQIATQRWLDFEREKSEWQRCYFELLRAQCPDTSSNKANWHKCRFLLPHIAYTMNLEPMTISLRSTYVEILMRTAKYFVDHNEYARARAMIKEAERIEFQGKDSVISSYGVSHIAASWRDMRIDSDQRRTQVLAILTQTFGAGSLYEDWILQALSTQFSKHNMLQNSRDMRDQYKICLERRRVLSDGCARRCPCRLCAALRDHSQFSEARAILTSPVALSYVDLDGGRGDLLRCIRCLAGILQRFDLCIDALEYYTIAAAAMEVYPGPEHPDTILCRKQLKDLTRSMYASNSEQLSAKVRTNPNVAVPGSSSNLESKPEAMTEFESTKQPLATAGVDLHMAVPRSELKPEASNLDVQDQPLGFSSDLEALLSDANIGRGSTKARRMNTTHRFSWRNLFGR